ncbi:dual-action HEIGH metallo-peptidase [Chitinophaga japonensis]|uniref:Dual-action HEIGH metallo-peptidase n=2 Tax=Chitinophaga japonensis TaxID=104662 RepID=A0A562TCF4_CHIJA|nr:dual-action HEIGH metallo-peptidase [Chitinophaga japonensis]
MEKQVWRYMPLFTCLIGIFTACKKAEVPQQPPDTDPIQEKKIDSKYLLRIHQLGFDTTGARNYDSLFIVEGDIPMAKSFLDTVKLSSSDKNGRHAYTNTLLNMNNIRIFLSETFWGNSTYYQGILRAVQEWNGVTNSSLNFHTISHADAGYNWEIINATLPGGILALNDYPGLPDINGVPGYNILVDMDYINSLNLTYRQISWIIAHEIGHMVGLRHSDWDLRGEGTGVEGANYFPNIPVEDYSSLMRAIFDINNDGSVLFSSYDRTAISTLYPLHFCNLQTYIDLPNSGPSGTISGSIYPSYRGSVDLVEWEITNNSGFSYTYSDADPEAVIPILAPGTYTFRHRIIISKGCTSTWNVRTITVL